MHSGMPGTYGDPRDWHCHRHCSMGTLHAIHPWWSHHQAHTPSLPSQGFWPRLACYRHPTIKDPLMDLSTPVVCTPTRNSLLSPATWLEKAITASSQLLKTPCAQSATYPHTWDTWLEWAIRPIPSIIQPPALLGQSHHLGHSNPGPLRPWTA